MNTKALKSFAQSAMKSPLMQSAFGAGFDPAALIALIKAILAEFQNCKKPADKLQAKLNAVAARINDGKSPTVPIPFRPAFKASGFQGVEANRRWCALATYSAHQPAGTLSFAE